MQMFIYCRGIQFTFSIIDIFKDCAATVNYSPTLFVEKQGHSMIDHSLAFSHPPVISH